MSKRDRASNKVQDTKGRMKEAAGDLAGDEELEHEGQADRAKAGLKDAGEHLKDVREDLQGAARKVKDAFRR